MWWQALQHGHPKDAEVVGVVRQLHRGERLARRDLVGVAVHIVCLAVDVAHLVYPIRLLLDDRLARVVLRPAPVGADFPELTSEDIRACLVFAVERERRLLGSVA